MVVSQKLSQIFSLIKSHRLPLEIICIFIVALALRTINLERWPRWYCDEGVYGQTGVNYFHGIWGYESWGPNFGPFLFSLLFGGPISILLEKSFFALRLPNAVLGAISCVLLYFIGTKLYNRSVGIIASLSLSIMSVPFDRMAMIQNTATFFFVLTMSFYLKDREDEKKYWNYLMGISAGMAFLSHFMGMVALIFIVFQSLVDHRGSQILKSIFTFFMLALLYPLLGAFLDWNGFIFDIFTYSTIGIRGLDLYRVVLMPILGDVTLIWAPYGSIYPNIWTIMGFVSIIYVLGRRTSTDSFVCISLVSVLFAYVFAGSIHWWHLTIIFPVYALAIASVFGDIVGFRGNFALLIILFMFVMLLPLNFQQFYPSLPVRYALYIFYFALLIVFLILLISQSRFSIKSNVSKGVLTWISRPNLRIALSVALCGLLLFTIGGVSFFNLEPIFTANDATDQIAVSRWLNTHVKGGSTVGGPSEIIYALKTGIQGVTTPEVILYTTHFEFATWTKELLPRFKQNASVWSLDYFVIDTPMRQYAGDGGKMLSWMVKGLWVPVFEVGDFQVYRKSESILAEVEAIQISSADSTLYWFVEDGKGDIAVDTADKLEGNASIAASLISNENGRVSIKYDPTGSWNFSGDNFLLLKVKYSSADWIEYYVAMRDTSYRFRFWSRPSIFSLNTWQTFFFPFDEFSSEEKGFDITKVNYVLIAAYDPSKPNTPITIYVDDILVGRY